MQIEIRVEIETEEHYFKINITSGQRRLVQNFRAWISFDKDSIKKQILEEVKHALDILFAP